MFTGIINQCGILSAIHKNERSAQLQIATQFTDLQIGESIAVDGVCLTVTSAMKHKSRADLFEMDCDVSSETLTLTSLGHLKPGSLVNLERALKLSDRLGGHFVTGHIDQVAYLEFRQKSDEFVVMRFKGIPKTALRNLIQKGSIAINGVSLTINQVLISGEGFEVMLIPQTLKETNLSQLKVGDTVNLEFDMLVKVINNQIKLPEELQK